MEPWEIPSAFASFCWVPKYETACSSLMLTKIQVCRCIVNRHAVPPFTHNPRMKTIGQRIRDLRVGRKLTQEQLAKAIGITQASMTDLETGKSKSPASQTLTKLARVLEVDPEWLMTGKGAQQPIASLSETEAELLLVYRALSAEGREYVLKRARSVHRDEYDRTGKHRRFGDDAPPASPGKTPDGH